MLSKQFRYYTLRKNYKFFYICPIDISNLIVLDKSKTHYLLVIRFIIYRLWQNIKELLW